MLENLIISEAHTVIAVAIEFLKDEEMPCLMVCEE